MEELQRALGRLEGKLDAVLENFRTSHTRFESIEERLLDLEKKVWYAAGIAAGLSLVLSFLVRKFL